jgi:putative ATP-binding cassette transporter
LLVKYQRIEFIGNKPIRAILYLNVGFSDWCNSALSQGQRKRLALLLLYMEGRQVLLLDEWAADQDPVFREVFYREILPEFKRAGKTVIAISHDDHYFDAADRIYKLDCGQIDAFDAGAQRFWLSTVI